MKKRVLKKMGVFLLAVIMAMTLLNGCGKKEGGTNPETTKAGSEPQNETGSSEGNENTGAEESSEDSGEWTGEISKIIMTYPTGGVEPTDMRLVQDAINEISRKEAAATLRSCKTEQYIFSTTFILDINECSCPKWKVLAEMCIRDRVCSMHLSRKQREDALKQTIHLPTYNPWPRVPLCRETATNS